MFAQEKKTVVTTTLWPCTTRLCAFLAAGAISLLIFLVDSSAPENIRAYNEMVLYGLGVSVSLLYAHITAKKRKQPKQCKVEPLEEVPSALERLRASFRSAFDEVRSATAQLIKDLSPPTAQRRTPGQDKPVVPRWAVLACVLFVATASFGLVLAAFSGRAISPDEATVLDAAPKVCGPDGKTVKKGGLSWGSISWLAIAFGLASGLCTVHPLQSGMTMGF